MKNNFSVLMSLYKNESPDFLNDCFISLREQSLPASEIILVIDGPVGSALEKIIYKWSDILPLKIIRLKDNMGLGYALNEGISYCTNEIIIRMDTDDICQRERFKIIVNYMDKNNSIGLIGTFIDEFIDEPTNIVSTRKVPLNREEIVNHARYRNPFNHMSVAFKKSVVDSAGGYHHHLYMEDYNLWLRVIASGVNVCNLDQSLILARIGHSMLTRRKGWKYIKSEFLLYRLKVALGFDSIISGFFIFLIRSIPRLLPIYFLKRLYGVIRK
ncbi:glycosyltransferase [Citrobacter gillenii]|uniref:glycosyltransferase n=1 Tax=Citrobacter gillenii TaxID=67828 RepID=UPI0039858849